MRHQERMARTPARSYILRVWDESSGPGLRGEVESIGTGERRFFPNSWALLDILNEWRFQDERPA
ncbi:MAG: hypothetical protein ACRDFS_02280 [Chloroflexota bacterium]